MSASARFCARVCCWMSMYACALGCISVTAASVKIASSTMQTISSTSVVPFWFFKRCFMGWSPLLP